LGGLNKKKDQPQASHLSRLLKAVFPFGKFSAISPTTATITCLGHLRRHEKPCISRVLTVTKVLTNATSSPLSTEIKRSGLLETTINFTNQVYMLKEQA